MTVREVFISFRDRHNLQHVEAPKESAMLDRIDSDPTLPGASRLAAVCFGMLRREPA